MIIKKIVYPVLTVLWMILIFHMSAQQGSGSSGLSEKVCRLIGNIFVPGFADRTAQQQWMFVSSIDFAVRKCAHMTEYAVLAVLWERTLEAFRGKCSLLRSSYRAALVIAVLYAAGDEIHQLFVSGRSGQAADVCIDAVGAMAGLLVLWLVCRLLRKTNSKT